MQNGNSTLKARAVRHAGDFVPSLLAERSPLCLDIALHPQRRLEHEAEVIVSGREIFSGQTRELRLRPADSSILAVSDGRLRLDIPAAAMPLAPGCWHILVNVEANGKNLAGQRAGSVAVYARAEGESLEHARASWNMARVEFAYDRKFQIYHAGYRRELPPIGDPFDEDNSEKFRGEYITTEGTWPELQHDGGLGFLLAAHVFRALGEESRARFCETVMRRTAHAIVGTMLEDDGQMASIGTVAEQRGRGYRSTQQAGFALKFLAQTYFYFRFGPGNDASYARGLLQQAERAFKFQAAQKLEPGCGECGCKVYDGRILAGLAWYCLAHRSEHGGHPEVWKIIHCAVGFVRHLLSNQGWYDTGCLVENECHTWCGNMNLLNGLLPTRRLMLDIIAHGDDSARMFLAHIEHGIREAWRFLVQTNGSILNGRAPFVPTRTSQWAAGNMYEICDEYLRQMEVNAGVRQFMEHLVLGAGAESVDCFHRNNTSGALMMACPEYRAVENKPALPWDMPAASSPIAG